MEDQYFNSCVKALKDSGSRITAARKAVIQCLSESTSPLSPKDILQYLDNSAELSSVDQVSVYRILEALLEHGLVHRVFPSGNFMACRHTSCSDALHVLTHCTECNKATEVDIPRQIAMPLLSHLKSELKFIPQDHVFQMSGLCRNCQRAHRCK